MESRPTLAVVIPTHNPHPGRLHRTLQALRAQDQAPASWECVLVDNASAPAINAEDWRDAAPERFRVVAEPVAGLAHARRAGLRATDSDLVVFADDDNVFASDYLSQAARIAAAQPRLGAFGGRSVPEFETAPAEWIREFFDLLALRDLGRASIVATTETPPRAYPGCAPIGAGMVLRRAAAQAWLAGPDRNISDRRGSELTSGGDNDIVLAIFGAGWDVGYFPELSLTHLIPPGRTDPAYLARLNRGIQKSWLQVLSRHGVCPWSPIPAWTVAPRKLKAWFAHRAWSGPAARIRWQGACGHFEGRASLAST